MVLIRQRELESDKNFYCLVFLRIGILPVDLTASPRHPTTWDMIILQQRKHSSGSGQTQGAQQRKLRRRVEIPSFISTSSKETNPGIKMKEVGALAPDLGASKSEDSSNFYVPHLTHRDNSPNPCHTFDVSSCHSKNIYNFSTAC